MAGLNILSQTPSPWQLSASSTSSSSFSLRCRHFYNFNIYNCGDIKCYKIGSSTFSLSGAPRSKPSAFSSQMLPQLSNSSGSGYSWMQDNSASCGNFSRNGRKQGPLNSVAPTERAQISSVDDLYDFICSGPLINKIGLTPEKVAESIDKWIEYGFRLCRLFQLNQLALNEPQKIRLYHYYIPVFLWCEQEISQHSSKFKDNEEIPPLVIGFSAPQGCGKTTLVFALEYLFKITGRKAATLSIDDFYLTAEEQAKLRENNPGNLLLEFRGNAGSHDLSLSVETLAELSKVTKEGVKMKLPRYDKSAYTKVEHLERSIPDFKDKNLEFLVSETDPEVLTAVEGFEVKILTFEHTTRRRLVKQKRVSANKIEKLLDVFPRLIFASGKERREKELPGAALFCLSFTKKDSRKAGAAEDLQDVQAKYEASLVDIATSLQLSRNILIAILSLQSWKPFMRRWMRAHILLLDAKLQTAVLDKAPKAGMEILKSMIAIAERMLPRSAENIALAVGSLCLVLPASAHVVKATASKFLLDWLSQHEHEYRQWSAAISLGVISSCLHLTDHKQKFENINALLEVASVSKSTLVKGACGAGLGFSCQALLARADADDNAHLGKVRYKIEEADLLRKIIRTLSQLICQVTPSSADVLETLSLSFPLESDNLNSEISGFLGSTSENLEEDVWGIAGLVLGLGNCIGAMYRAGIHNAVLNVKSLLISWIPHPTEITAMSKNHEILLSVGSCLSVPIAIAMCQRFELTDDADMEYLLGCYKELISELLSVKRFDTFHQSLLMASCLGAGSLIGVVLNEGLHPLKIEHIKELLLLFRKSYSDSNPPLVHLGAMLGVVNALGAGAGTLVEPHPLSSSHAASDQKESSYISSPLITNAVLEPELTSLVQEIFLVVQNSDAHQLQQHAAWAISFLRQHLWFKEPQNDETTAENDSAGLKTVLHSFPEDSTVMKLSLWLMHLNYLGTDAVSHVNTVSSVLRCLSHASRLPPLDWGAIIRRCMRYEGQVAGLLTQDISFERGNLRGECLLFSLSHAKQFDPLLSFLDEQCDIPRLRMLEPRLQFFLLSHLADLVKIFSGSRVVKLFEDVANLLSTSICSESCDSLEKSSFRISCWRGLKLCLDESSHHTQEYKSSMEKCMELLFTSLPSAHTEGLCQGKILEEWCEAIRCLEKTQQEWLLDLLKVSEVNIANADSLSFETVRKVRAKAKLVQSGSLSLTVLGKLKTYLLDCRSQDIWDALTEVAITVQHAEGNAKRQWLIEALEISCVTSFPSTALQFIGLLCGSCCVYRPVLIANKFTVLSDLPVTLTSLLSDSTWMVVADAVVSCLWKSTERIYEWNKQIKGGGDYLSYTQPIDTSENDIACFLLLVMHQACVSLKDHLPPEKQLQLANMVVPSNIDAHELHARLNCNVKSLPLL